MYPLEIRLTNPREYPLISVKLVVYVTDTLRKMASLGTGFSSSKKVFTSDEVLAFLTSENENTSDLEGESELLDTATPRNSISGDQILPQSHPQTVEKDESITEAPMDVFVREEVEDSEDGTSPNESQLTNGEVSILQHQPDESNIAPFPSSDSESECSDRAGFYDSPDSAEEITSSSSEGSGDSDSDVSSESACEEQTATSSSTRGRGRGRGRGQRRGRGRGRGRGYGRGRGRVVDHSSGDQIVSSTTVLSQVQLPNAAIDISIVDDRFVRPPPFNPSRTPGPHLPPNTDLSAISLFELFFDNDTITHFVQATNAYAEEKKHKKAMYKRYKYKQLTNDEMKRFVTVLLLLGITGVRSYTKAWNSRNAQYILRLNELMTRNRFEAIASFFHIVTPEEENSFGDNPLRKILPLHQHMKTRCCELYQPLQQLSCDERMVKSKARTRFRQYMKDKPSKWGFKYWVLSDPTAYTINFDLYCGAAQTERSEHGLGFETVTTLVENYHNQNYEVYCDNFYSSPALFLKLLESKITATGTLRTNRRGTPKDVTAIKNFLKRKDTPRGKGYYMREQNSPLVFGCWNDNSIVATLSTCYPGHSINTIKRKGKNPATGRNEEHQVPVPVIIEKYNKFMGGVDKSDQYLQYHSSLRRTIRYWKTLFYHMLDVAVVNSMVIYNWGSMELGGKPLSENQFRDTLILQMIEKYRAPHPQSIPGQLPPILILPPHQCRIHHGSIIVAQRERCRYCAYKGDFNLTNRRCTDCPFVPPLCQTVSRDCHTVWHSPPFDTERSAWFSQMIARTQSGPSMSTPLQPLGSKRRGRPSGAINRRRRRGKYC